MELARSFGIAFVISLGALAGCASETSSDAAPVDDGGEVDELNSESLRDATTIKGTVGPGGAITLHYDSSDREYPRKVPYLALEISNALGAYKDSAGLHFANGPVTINTQSMSVQGNFPSTPKALVVDGNFKVLSKASGVAQSDGSQKIDMNASRDASKRFLLIRDTRWSKPMDFHVTIGR